MIRRIVSGGQTGVDRAALDAAMSAGLDCGGWCPKGRRAEDGVIPPGYPLKETPGADYRTRTRRNVADSDGTLILAVGALTGGTALTRETALAEGKPLMLVDLDLAPPVDEVREWIRSNGIRTLNVAGPRESQRPGVSRCAGDFLSALLISLNPEAGAGGGSAPGGTTPEHRHD